MTTAAGAAPRTLFDKIWAQHVVAEVPDGPSVLYVDLHLVHEVTSPQAFAELAARGVPVRRPDRTFAVMDHSIPTVKNPLAAADPSAAAQLRQLAANCEAHGITLWGAGDPRQGIVHVVGPEQGLTRPGMTIVCGDSHTATHGAFGALAFGIGTSQVGHVLATQCLLQRRPRTLAVEIEGGPGGALPAGVTAKDVILAVIARLGAGGGTGYVIEYRGSAVRALDMEARMTLCNMSIEAGARAGLVAPDDTTFDYLAGRAYAPTGTAFDRAVARWRTLATDDGAAFDHVIRLDAAALAPMVTWGTTPAQACAVDGAVPRPEDAGGDDAAAAARSLAYMRLEAGRPIAGQPVDVVFIGSCTNSRLGDLRAAARVLTGRKVAAGVRALVVPGSHEVKRAAEAEGLDRVFRDAGAEWREPGCSMCIAMNGDQIGPGQLAVSTSNRNFEGRQGKGGRTVLASPYTAAASAVAGTIADPRPYLEARP
ncbi:MAG: 3-isopropylmalate dehydratase large subunit [Kofleriaceae bacterium]|nr:3-isopropylmalate dehydratase large subunit [Kofleriaceae bacterium]MCB9573587.1 3-isopropylmalate dehydratase large subunit [Kofleriaceae bacterium]